MGLEKLAIDFFYGSFHYAFLIAAKMLVELIPGPRYHLSEVVLVE